MKRRRLKLQTFLVEAKIIILANKTKQNKTKLQKQTKSVTANRIARKLNGKNVSRMSEL